MTPCGRNDWPAGHRVKGHVHRARLDRMNPAAFGAAAGYGVRGNGCRRGHLGRGRAHWVALSPGGSIRRVSIASSEQRPAPINTLDSLLKLTRVGNLVM